MKFIKSESSHDCYVGLQLLLIYYTSRGKSINNSHGNVISNLCLDLILQRGSGPFKLHQLGAFGNDILQTAIKLFAINLSFSSVESYETVWLTITEDCAAVLTLLGLLESSQGGQNRTNLSRLDLMSASLTTNGIRGGINRGVHLEIIHRGVLMLLSELLKYGCSSGAICLNYSQYLFPSLIAGICHQLEVKSQDPKFFIQNVYSIAPAHVAVISSSLKISSLSFLGDLLKIPQPLVGPNSLVPITCRVISSTLSSFSQTNHSVIKEGLHLLTIALPLFPLTIVQRSMGALQQVVQLFENLIDLEITKPTSFPSNTSSTNITTTTHHSDASTSTGLTFIDSSHDSNQQRPNKKQKIELFPPLQEQSFHSLLLSIGDEIIFQTIGTLFLAASPFLPLDLRTQLERIVCSGLFTLQKGILRSNYTNEMKLISHYNSLLSHDFTSSSSSSSTATTITSTTTSTPPSTSTSNRSLSKIRLRRVNCESIRLNSNIQNQFLLLALYEVTSLYGDGSRSGNLSLLKSTCQLCFKYYDTSRQSLEILLILENILFSSNGNISLEPLHTAVGGSTSAGIGAEISSTVFQLTSPHEENYSVNKMIPMIQKHQENVNNFKLKYLEESKINQFDQIGADSNTATEQPTEEMEEKRIPTPYPTETTQSHHQHQHHQQQQHQHHHKPLQALPTPLISQVEKDSDSEDDLPAINLADPDCS